MKLRKYELRSYNILVQELVRSWLHVKWAPHVAETRPATLIEFAVVTKISGGAAGLQTAHLSAVQGTVLRRFLHRIKIAFC
jgi:hypothetical protein